MELGDLVRSRRKPLGMTEEDLAFRAGAELRFVRELERGKPSLRMDKVNEVLFLFGYELGPLHGQG